MRFALVGSFTSMFIAGALGAQSLSARADSALKAAEAQGFSGVVRLEKDGALVLEKGYGLAIRQPPRPFTPSTVVQIGSNTKDFTAVAILQLQERAKLDIHDSIGKYFPSAPSDKRGITILQLMKHEAGFPLGLGGDFEPVSREQLIANAMNFRLLFNPGEKKFYSNTGYALLAAIIEKVSGKTYDEYVRDNMLKPLGLTHTGFLLPEFKQAELAHGYPRDGTDAGNMISKPHAKDGPYWNLRGNGGMLSTVGDMHGFYKALFDSERLLKASSRAVMFRTEEPIGLAGSDGVNFFLYDRDPIAHSEMIIASNDAKFRAPMIRQALAQVLGLPMAVGRAPESDAILPKGKPPAPGIAAVIGRLVAALNTGDNKALLAFITENFDTDPPAPTPEERLSRIGGMHQNLGDISVSGMYDSGEGPVQVVVKTQNEGPGMLIVDIGRVAPYKIKRLGIQIGGS